MKMKKVALSSALIAILAGVVGCGGDNNNSTGNKNPNASASISGTAPTQKYDNDKKPLVLSTQELDGVFNPFFSSSATDSSVVGMTQLSMFSTDKDGNLAYGLEEPTVVLDYDQKTEGTGDDETTTYTFVLKNDLVFSDGSPLTIKNGPHETALVIPISIAC